MTTTINNVILNDEKRFEVLGLVSIALPGPWWWHTEDMNNDAALGAIFRCYEEGNENEIAHMLVADVTHDPDEPDISTFEDSDIPAFDLFLETELRNGLELDGRELIRYMSSHLNYRSYGKALVTAYIARDQCRDRQDIVIRIRVHQRNVVIAGCFDVSRAELLAKPIFLALNDATPLDKHSTNGIASNDLIIL